MGAGHNNAYDIWPVATPVREGIVRPHSLLQGTLSRWEVQFSGVLFIKKEYIFIIFAKYVHILSKFNGKFSASGTWFLGPQPPTRTPHLNPQNPENCSKSEETTVIINRLASE